MLTFGCAALIGVLYVVAAVRTAPAVREQYGGDSRALAVDRRGSAPQGSATVWTATGGAGGLSARWTWQMVLLVAAHLFILGPLW